jgi:hypothetical protein
MSPTVFLAICILGCDALLYFLFQWTYGERRRGLAGKRKSNVAADKSHHSQPMEYVSARSQHRFAGSRPDRMRTPGENEKVTPIRRPERLAYQAIAARLSRAKP